MRLAPFVAVLALFGCGHEKLVPADEPPVAVARPPDSLPAQPIDELGAVPRARPRPVLPTALHPPVESAPPLDGCAAGRGPDLVLDQESGPCLGQLCSESGSALLFADLAMTVPVLVSQSFTAARSGRLERIQIQTINFVPYPLAVEVSIVPVLASGLPPSWEVLDAQRLAVGHGSAPTSNVGVWIDVDFASPAIVSANSVYAVVVHLVPPADPAALCVARGTTDRLMCNWSLGYWASYLDFSRAASGHYPGGSTARSWSGLPGPEAEIDGWQRLDPSYYDETLRTFVRAERCE